MPEPRAIIFDVDGTLYSQTKLRLWLTTAFARHPWDALRALPALRAFRDALEQLRETGGALADVQYALASRLARIEEAELRRQVERWFVQAPLPLLARCRRPEVVLYMDAARARGARLGVFSDYPAEAKLDALRLRGYFDVVADASHPDIQALKPSPRGLLAVAARLGVAADETLYVGDRPLDARAAARAGMRFAAVQSIP